MGTFDSSDAALDRHLLVSFTLDSETYRVADEYVTLDDGRDFSGILLNASPLQRTVGRILDPRIQRPSMKLRLDNADGGARDKIDSLEFANRVVSVEVGHGTAAANYQTIFTGTVRFPGGIQWDDTEVTIQLDSSVQADERVLPINKFFTSTYSNLRTADEFKTIPIVFGDWRTTAGGGETLPAYCIDTTENNGGRWKVADHELADIEDVYVDGVSANFTAAEADLDIGEFVITDSITPADVTVTVNCEGMTDAEGDSTGTRLDTLPDFLEAILERFLDVASGDIDDTALSDWASNLDSNDHGRRWVSTEQSSSDIISSLMVDGFADFTMDDDGNYKPVYRIVDISSGISTFDESDLKSQGPTEKDFTVFRDEERVYANQIVAVYRHDPISGEFARRYDVEDSAAIQTVGTRVRRRLNLSWLYKQNGAENRASRELYTFSQELETLRLGVTARGLTLGPTDQFNLLYNKYDLGGGVGTPFMVRSAEPRHLEVETVLKVWNLTRLAPGRWTESAAATWLLSTAAERASQGYWTDSNGYADPGGTPDEASKKSKWY